MTDWSGWREVGSTDDTPEGQRSSLDLRLFGEPSLDPASRAVARTPGAVDWTIGEALAFLRPQPPRRTLSRWLASIEPIGRRSLPQGGPEARTYPAAEIMIRHAAWAKRHA